MSSPSLIENFFFELIKNVITYMNKINTTFSTIINQGQINLGQINFEINECKTNTQNCLKNYLERQVINAQKFSQINQDIKKLFECQFDNIFSDFQQYKQESKIIEQLIEKFKIEHERKEKLNCQFQTSMQFLNPQFCEPKRVEIPIQQISEELNSCSHFSHTQQSIQQNYNNQSIPQQQITNQNQSLNNDLLISDRMDTSEILEQDQTIEIDQNQKQQTFTGSPVQFIQQTSPAQQNYQNQQQQEQQIFKNSPQQYQQQQIKQFPQYQNQQNAPPPIQLGTTPQYIPPAQQNNQIVQQTECICKQKLVQIQNCQEFPGCQHKFCQDCFLNFLAEQQIQSQNQLQEFACGFCKKKCFRKELVKIYEDDEDLFLEDLQAKMDMIN